MRFKGLDLNLLVALEALLDEGSVSRAAERLHISQPAMSGALSRLRDYFRDELIILIGKRMYPTAYAEGLLPHLRVSLRGLETLVSSTAINPTTSSRTFRIVGPDYLLITFVAKVVSELATTAQDIKLHIPTNDDSIPNLAKGKVDLLLVPDSMAQPDHPKEPLLEARFVVVGWSGNVRF